MSLGTLSKNLMKKTVAAAGDGAKDVSLVLIGESVYDIETGTQTTEETVVSLGKGLFASVSEAESRKFNLTVTTHKVVVPYLHWQAAAVRRPRSADKIRLLPSDDDWEIEKLHSDGFDSAFCFYISQP